MLTNKVDTFETMELGMASHGSIFRRAADQRSRTTGGAFFFDPISTTLVPFPFYITSIYLAGIFITLVLPSTARFCRSKPLDSDPAG